MLVTTETIPSLIVFIQNLIFHLGKVRLESSLMVRRCCQEHYSLFFSFLRPHQKRTWLTRAKGSCHLRDFDRYTFTVGVKMTDDASQNDEIIQGTVTHRFYHTMLTLQENTQVTDRAAMLDRGSKCKCHYNLLYDLHYLPTNSCNLLVSTM